MTVIRRTLLLVGSLPIFVVVSTLLSAKLTRPSYESVSLEDPPTELAVIGAWSDALDAVACRAFYYRDLTSWPDSLPPLRYALTDDELSVCRAAFAQYNRDRHWEDDFPWDFRGYFASFEWPGESGPDRVVVAYWSDDDRIADTRYRIDPATGHPTDFEFRAGFGPAMGIGSLLFGTIGGTVAWLAFVVVMGLRWWRSARDDRGPGALAS